MQNTIRSKLDINNKKRLIEVVDTKKQFSSIFKDLIGKKIVLAYNSKLSDSGEIVQGGFRGGLFKKIEFYKSEQTPNSFDGHIWFSHEGYATGLSNLYDIATLEINNKNLKLEDLKIFRFGAHAGSEDENAHIIHKDVFSAYNSLLESGEIKSREQYLYEVIKITPGFFVYEHNSH
ncbi:hypothetical protein KAI04_03665 [Candidatus Pacearchaeota archaeon]|nr:hypothetical protein [Candidatus Pacearchaeota archaeon]